MYGIMVTCLQNRHLAPIGYLRSQISRKVGRSGNYIIDRSAKVLFVAIHLSPETIRFATGEASGWMVSFIQFPPPPAILW